MDQATMECCSEQPTSLERPPKVKRRRWELLFAIVPILLAVGVAVVVFTTERSSPVRPPADTGTVTGTPAGTDQAVDGGQGNVVASAKFERGKSSTEQLVFTVSLNTHSVDLSGFNPLSQIRLRTPGGSELQPQVLDPGGERSSHHQNYTLSFARPRSADVMLVVRNVAGVTERDLPFTL